jgi:DNA-binding transcriptional LysR family regulator
MKKIFHRDLPLDSRQLNAFVTLAETGSFTETARRLALTQSAISHSMRALEAETHCRLLTKMGKTISLTEAGEALLHHVRLGLKEFNKGREALERLRKWGRQRLRLGAGCAISQHFLPGVLVDLRHQYPKLMPTIKMMFSSDDADCLRSGEIDCYVGEEPDASEDLEFTPIFQSPLRVVFHPAHRWSLQKHISVEELSSEPCLLPLGYSLTRRAVERALLGQGTTLNVLGETDSLETIKQLIKSGFGIGILPEWIINEEVAARRLRALPFAPSELRQTWGLLRWRQRRPMDATECAFRNLCVKAGKKLTTL